MLFMNKVEFSSLIDCFVWMKPERWHGFLSGFPPIDSFINVVSMGEKMYLYII
jgi:hypothetical protein